MSFFLPAINRKCTDWNVVFEVQQIERLGCLFTLTTENALLGMDHLEKVLSDIEYSSWTWFLNCLFLLHCYLYTVVDFNLGLRVIRCKSTWCPFSMHLSNAFLNIKPDVYLLVPCQFDDWDSELSILVNIWVVRDWSNWPFSLLLIIHALENWSNVQRSDFHYLLLCVFYVQNEILLANSAVFNTFQRAWTFPWILEILYFIADEGNEADSLAKPLVMQYWSVLYNAN